jgi:hypothetical protein
LEVFVRAMKRFALVSGTLLLFNMVALPFWWGGVSVSGGFLGFIQYTILAGFIFILLFDLLSAGWVLTQVCWVSGQRREEGCQKGWLLVLAVLAVAGMMGAKVMVDEIARETPLGGAAGEWVVLYVCLSLQLSYIIAALLQKSGSQEGEGV